MDTYTLNRTGQVINIGGCGLEGETLCFYNASITVSELQLNQDKFMVEHGRIHFLAEHTIEVAISCEVACINFINSIEEFFLIHTNYQRMNLEEISVTVGMVGGDANFTLKRKY